jgi:alkylglycerol monooxygenase
MDIVPYAVPFFILAMLLELAYGLWIGRNTYRLNDAVGSLFMGSLRTSMKLIFIGLGGVVFYAIEQHYSLWRMDRGSVWTWVFAWFAYDLCYYWFHRISHERQIFWASHVAHHQSEDYNLSTALRQTSTGALLGWVFYVPLFLVGVPAEVYVTVASVNLIYQFWVHTEHVPKLGVLESFMITASNHRVHHAQNDIYMDRNYGGVFLIWDRMFGSFQEELDEEPCVYGIRGPLRTFNPLWANLHIYVGMFVDAWRARSWKDKVWMLFSRTGWRPADVAEQYPRPKNDLADFHRYDPQTSKAVKIYAFAQMVVLTSVGTAVLFSPDLSKGYTTLAVAAMAVSMVCTTQWLDVKNSALSWDALRLLGLLMIAGFIWNSGGQREVPMLLVAYCVLNGLTLLMLNRRQPAESLPA